MPTPTTEIPAIIADAKAAGCENADQINGYLAAEVSRLRSERVILLGAGEVCVASSTHLETKTPSLTFRRLEKPAEPGSLLTPDVHEVEKFLSIVVVATRPAAQVLHTAATSILARFPAVEGEKVTDAQTVTELLMERDRLRDQNQKLAEIADRYVSDLKNVVEGLDPEEAQTLQNDRGEIDAARYG